MITLLIIVITVLSSSFATRPTSGSTVGLCYGRDANNLPSPAEVVALLQSKGVSKVRIFDANQDVLSAFLGSGISVVVGASNSELANLASSASAAMAWVQSNIQPYSSIISHIAVGNEVLTQDTGNTQNLIPAMSNVYSALQSLNLHTQIHVSTTHAMDVIDPSHSYPPSSGAFSSSVQSTMSSILSFLSNTGSPFMANVYPFFAYYQNTAQISLSYTLFEPGTSVDDNGFTYTNLFDAQIDTLVAAMEALGFPGIPVMVTETGWPNQGDPSATVANAQTYNNNLIAHVPNGSPKRPGVLIESYIFAIFNENLKPSSPPFEQHWGIFNADQSPVYSISQF